jgi:hypothetical protein
VLFQQITPDGRKRSAAAGAVDAPLLREIGVFAPKVAKEDSGRGDTRILIILCHV